MQEETIRQNLIEAFPALAEAVRIQRARRIWVETPLEQFYEILDHCADKLDVNIMLTITGLDEVEDYGVIYHMASPAGVIVNLKVKLPKDKAVLRSVTPRFPSAEAYERELKDLLGIEVTGLPEGPRYPLPDKWPDGQYPLRKDWTPEAASPTEGGSHA
jgi:membrane-bound hydrogenase subunit beta